MITEKDIQTQIGSVLNDAGFNVVASEIDEGFEKPAVFVAVASSEVRLQCCGGATEEVTDSIEIKYISALETVEDCIDTAHKMKELFLYQPFYVQERRFTIEELEFDIEKTTLYVYFDITFIQAVTNEEVNEDMSELTIRGDI
jgi:hypothetical protein|nr:MAG TPA: tail completion protein [Caudoviricetes sp.]